MRRAGEGRTSTGRLVSRLAGAAVVAVALAETAFAGPGGYYLTDEALNRLDALSFCLVLFLASAGGVRWLWNRVRRDVPGWPGLTVGGALAVAALWGLASLVSAMLIAGSGGFLSAGAGPPGGATERGAGSDSPSSQAASEIERQARVERLERLEGLRSILWKHAERHDGRFPASLGEAVVRPEARTTPPPIEMPYRYHAPALPVANVGPLVSEPDVYDDRLVLLTSGEIVTWQRERPVP